MDASVAMKKRQKKKPISSASSAAHSSLHATQTNSYTVKAPGEDDVCFICHDGGTIVMCDRRHCGKAYHPACVGRDLASFTTLKTAWLCARHFCSKCSKQPCTYCVMCPNSFCTKCMPTEVYLELSEEAGLCETCSHLVQNIELQHTTQNRPKASNLEGYESLFRDYWLLLKRFYAYNLGNFSSNSLRISDKAKRARPSIIQTTSKYPANVGASKNDVLSGPRSSKEIIPAACGNVRKLVKRRRNPANCPVKKKLRVLRLLDDSCSENEGKNKPSSGDVFVGNLQPSSIVPAREELQQTRDPANALPSQLVTVLPLTGVPRAVMDPASLSVDSNTSKEASMMTASSKECLPQNSKDSFMAQVSAFNNGLGAARTLAYPRNIKPPRPAAGALEQMAAALQTVKARKCFNGKLPKITQGVQIQELVLDNDSKEDEEVVHMGMSSTLASLAGQEEIKCSGNKNGSCLENKRDIEMQNTAFINQTQKGTGKHLDGDQHSDISVELGTVNFGKGHDNSIQTEGSTRMETSPCPEDEAEIMFPKKLQEEKNLDFTPGVKEHEACPITNRMNETLVEVIGKADVGVYAVNMQSTAKMMCLSTSQENGHNSFAAVKQEHDTGLIAEVTSQAQGSQTMHDAIRGKVSANNIDAVVDKAEGRMRADKIPSTAAMKCGAQPQSTMNLSEEASHTDFQGYATNRHPVQSNPIDNPIQCNPSHVDDQVNKDWHVKGHTDFQGYAAIRHPLQSHPITNPIQSNAYNVDNQVNKDKGLKGHTLPATVSMNNSDEQAMEWFYQDTKQITHGPFSLKQLRKWRKTGVFPPDLSIWKIVYKEKFCNLLRSALDAKEMAIPSRMETQKCAATAEDCLSYPPQRGRISIDEDNSWNMYSSSILCDAGVLKSQKGWQFTSTHGVQKDPIEDDWILSREKGKLDSLACWNKCESTLFRSNDGSGNGHQNQGMSVWDDSITTKGYEKVLSISKQIDPNSSLEPHTFTKETFGGEGDCKLSPAQTKCESSVLHTSAKGNLPEKERNCKLSPGYTKYHSSLLDTSGKLMLPGEEREGNATLTSIKRIAAEGGGRYGHSPACIDENFNLPCAEQKLELHNTSDNGQGPSTLGIHDLGSPETILEPHQIDVTEKEDMLHQYERSNNLELLVVNKEHENQRGETIVESDWNHDKMSKGAPDSEDREQKQETFADDGWRLAESVAVNTEAFWATQLDALKAEVAALDRCRDELWNNFIGEVACADNHWQSLTLPENTSAEGKNSVLNLEQRQGRNLALDKGCTLSNKQDGDHGTWSADSSTWSSVPKMEEKERNNDYEHGWAVPDKVDLEQGLWSAFGSTWSTDFQIQDSEIQRVPDLSSMKLQQPRSDKRDENQTQLRPDGTYEDAVYKRRKERSLTHGIDDGQEFNSNERYAAPQDAVRKESFRSCSKQIKKDGKCFTSLPGKSFKQEQEGRGFHARNYRKSRSGIHDSSPENVGRRIEVIRASHAKTDRRSLSRERNGTQKEVRRLKSRDHWSSFVAEQRTSPDRAKKKTEEFCASHSRSGKRSPERGERCPKLAGNSRQQCQISHTRRGKRSPSRERRFTCHSRSGKRSPEYGERCPKLAGKSREQCQLSHSRRGERSPSRKRRFEFHPRSGEKAPARERRFSASRSISREWKREQGTHSDHARNTRDKERNSYPESAKNQEFGGIHALRSKPRECESPRNALEEVKEMKTHSLNDRRSHSRGVHSSSESAGKREKDGRRFYSRDDKKSILREEKSCEARGGRREDRFWRKSHDLKPHSKGSPRSGAYFSPRNADDAQVYLKKGENSSKFANLRLHRKDLDDGVSRKRWLSDRKEGSSPCITEHRSRIHVIYNTQQPPQSDRGWDERGWTSPSSPSNDRGWTPLSSPLKAPPKCVSPIVARVERFGTSAPGAVISTRQLPQVDDRGWTPLSAPAGYQGWAPSSPPLKIAPKHVLRIERSSYPSTQSGTSARVQESHVDLPPPTHMKLPSPPPLPAETSHIYHIDDYATLYRK